MVIKKFSLQIRPKDKDMKKRWFFQVKVFNPETGEYQHVKKYDPLLNRLKTIEERVAILPAAEKRINIELQNSIYWASLEEYQENEKAKAVQAPDNDNTPIVGDGIIAVLRTQLATHRLRKKSMTSLKSKINNLDNWMKEHNLTELSVDDATKFLSKFSSSVTRNSNLSTLTGLLEEANYPNPFSKFKKLKENKQGRMYFTHRQLKELKQNILPNNKMLWVACEMQYFCLIRNGEMRGLRVGDIDLDSGLIIVRGEIAKNWKTLPVKIPTAFFQLLSDYIADAPSGDFVFSKMGKPGDQQISTKYLSVKFDKYLNKLGMKTPRHSFYSLKKSGAKGFLDMPNANYKALQRQGRWQDLREVESYT